jgi:hypothetical protein
MKKSISNSTSNTKFESLQVNKVSSSQPPFGMSDKREKKNEKCEELCVRRSSLLSVPSSFSDTSSQQDTPIKIPIRATSTVLHSRRIQMILPDNVAPMSPLPLQIGHIDDTTGHSSVSTIVDVLDETVFLHDIVTCASDATFSNHDNEEEHSQNSTKSELRRDNSSSDSCRSTCDNLDTTINLHESFLCDNCSPIEEFLTEPFWSESQVDRLLDD